MDRISNKILQINLLLFVLKLQTWADTSEYVHMSMALPAGYSAFATVSLVSSVGYIGSVTWTSILLIWTIQTTLGTISVSSTWKERYSHLIEHHISQSLPLWLNKHPRLCKKHLGNCKKVGKTWNGLTKRNNSTKLLLLHHPLLLKESFLYS